MVQRKSRRLASQQISIKPQAVQSTQPTANHASAPTMACRALYLGMGLLLAIVLALLGGRPAYALSPILYVAPEGSGDGSSWEHAATLQHALASATSGDEIWVQTGIYTPGTAISDTFSLSAGLALYGGFAGSETDISQRDWLANPTILSGDIDHNDIAGANGVVTDTDNITGLNTLHVVTVNGSTLLITNSTVLNGFTITAGNAHDAPAPENSGAGFFCNGEEIDGTCSPHLENLIFSGNWADSGGAIYNDGSNIGVSSPTLVNVTFAGNSADDGGAMYNNGANGGESNPTLVNVTFAGNSADNGGAMYNNGFFGLSGPHLANTIFWGNTATISGAQISNVATTAVITTSLVQGGINGAGVVNDASSTMTGGGNLDADPLFVGASDLRLQVGSPAIDTGSNGAIVVTTDLEGNPRFADGDGDGTATVDMGAYEALGYHTLAVTLTGSGSGHVDRAPLGSGCASPCTALYQHGSAITLTAAPDSGSAFSGWSGDCIGTGTCVLTINNSESVTATFAENLPPNFTSTPGLTTTAGSIYTYTIGAVDPDPDDTLTFSVTVKPPWLTLTTTGNGTATLTGIPGFVDIGTNPVQLRVQDAAGAFSMQTFSIDIILQPSTALIHLPLLSR